jgi:RHS repeat-associated protein
VDSDGPGAGAATLKTRFLLGDAVDQVLAQETVTGNEVLWLLQDNLGSVRETVKNDGTVNSRVDFDPFGNMVSIIDPSSGGAATTLKTRLNFTGQEWDADLKLIWYSDGTGRGRWYDPATGTFINQDSAGFAAGDENLYRYVGNGAPYLVDPSGREIAPGFPPLPSPGDVRPRSPSGGKLPLDPSHPQLPSTTDNPLMPNWGQEAGDLHHDWVVLRLRIPKCCNGRTLRTYPRTEPRGCKHP